MEGGQHSGLLSTRPGQTRAAQGSGGPRATCRSTEPDGVGGGAFPPQTLTTCGRSQTSLDEPQQSLGFLSVWVGVGQRRSPTGGSLVWVTQHSASLRPQPAHLCTFSELRRASRDEAQTWALQGCPWPPPAVSPRLPLAVPWLRRQEVPQLAVAWASCGQHSTRTCGCAPQGRSGEHPQSPSSTPRPGSLAHAHQTLFSLRADPTLWELSHSAGAAGPGDPPGTQEVPCKPNPLQ